MKRISIIYVIVLFSFSCERTNKEKTTNQARYDNIFGSWIVTHAEFIRSGNSLYSTNIEDQQFESRAREYIYKFNQDSTFERGRPTVQHGNIEEAHGRYSISPNLKTLTWFLEFTTGMETEPVNLELVSLNPIQMILIEELGGRNRLLQVLERPTELE